MKAQTTVGRFARSGGHYRASAGGAAVILALASGLALGFATVVERLTTEGTPGEGAGAAAVERSTTSPSAKSADLGPIVTPERCVPIGSGYMDSSIVAESRKIDCGWVR